MLERKCLTMMFSCSLFSANVYIGGLSFPGFNMDIKNYIWDSVRVNDIEI